MKLNLRVLGLAACLVLELPAVAAGQDLPNRLSVLQAERAKYPATINAQQAGELLNAVAFALRAEGFGLLRKDAGNRCPIPNSSITVSCDWLVHRPSGKGCDVLGSGPDSDPPANGPATPTWCGGDPFDVSKFVEPTAPSNPPPPPPPPASSAASAELQQQQIVLLLQIVTQQQQQLQALADQNQAIVRGLAELKAAIAAGVKIRF